MSDLRERLEALLDRTDDDPGGVDARTRGSNRSAVDAQQVEIDEEAVERAGQAGEDFGQGLAVSDGSAPRTRAEKAKQAAKRRLQKQRESLQERADEADLKAALKRKLKAQARGTDSDEFVDTDQKSRNQKVVERATDAATIRAPMGGSLRTVGDERVVTEMARSSAARDGGLLGGPPADFGGGGWSGSPEDDGDAGLLTWEDEGSSSDDQDESGAMEFEDPFGLAGGDDDDDDDSEVWL